MELSSTWIAELSEAAIRHRAVDHPYLRALEAGEAEDPAGAVAYFARIYPVYSRHFPTYLSTVIGKLEDAAHRDLLRENLLEERGHLSDEDLLEVRNAGIDPELVQDVPHSVLFRRFQDAIGVTTASNSDEVARHAVVWRNTLLDVLGNGTAAHAVGALGLGTESVVKHIYPYILRAIRRWKPVERRHLAFFELHCLVDDKHNAALAHIASALGGDERGRQEVRDGMLAALEARAHFWDAMLKLLPTRMTSAA